MKKMSLIALFTLMMTVVSFQGKTQEITTVMIIGEHDPMNIMVKTIDNNLEVSKTKHKRNKSDYHLVLKKEIDQWLKQGYKIKSTSTASNNTFSSTTYILTKEE